MNTPKTLLGMLTISLILAGAGTAMAIGQSFGGVVEYSADANAHYGVNYQPILDKSDEGKAQAEATATSTIDTVTGTVTGLVGQAQGQAEAQKDQAVKASVATKGSLLDDIQGNADAFGGWIASLFVKPKLSSPAATTDVAHATKDLSADMKPGYVGLDGKAHADVMKDLRGAVDADYNLPPPPTPKASFGAALQMAITEFFHLG